MVWGAIHQGGRSELVMVDGAMNRYRYIQIPRNQMLPWATGVFGRTFVYFQDNAPPHTARDTAAFLDQQDVEVMDCSESRHEPSWACLESNVSLDPRHGWPPSTVAELKNAVRQDCSSTLVESMPRVRALLVAGTTLLVQGSEGHYHVPPICSELFHCAVLIFSFGAKCEIAGCALLAWLHTLPAYCQQFDGTICICAAFSHIH